MFFVGLGIAISTGVCRQFTYQNGYNLKVKKTTNKLQDKASDVVVVLWQRFYVLHVVLDDWAWEQLGELSS